MGSINSTQNGYHNEEAESENIDPYYMTFNPNSQVEFESNAEKLNEDKKRYYVKEPLETQDSSHNQLILSPIPVPLNPQENQKKLNFKVIGRKRGRKSNKENQQEKRPPRKNDRDNIQSKVQVHYMTFIVNFMNCVLKLFRIEKQFQHFDYKSKKVTNFDNSEKLKKQKLEDILKLKRSSRYEKSDEKHNENLLEEIKNNNLEVIKNILEENYLIFFEKVYYKSERKISLTKYGSDEILCLDAKTQTYRDKMKSFNDPIYETIFDNYVNELYFQRKINFNPTK
jgi:hypothetical protein